MPTPLAAPADVADVWRPLTSDETTRVSSLILKASALLRQRVPWVDARIARFTADPTDPGGLDPVTVAVVVATAVKRFLSNVAGVVSETTGPYSVSYAIRGDKDIRGELFISDQDVQNLAVPSKGHPRIGTIKSRPRLAPWPYGAIGGVPAGGGTADIWLAEQQGGFPELPYLPTHDPAS